MKDLTVALVLDDREGMMIFGKRQSRDRVLIADFVSSMKDTPIFISPFSKVIFEPHKEVNIVENPFRDSCEGGACFIENYHLVHYIDMIGTLIIYRWNELYPSDVRFDLDVEAAGFKLVESYDFEGSSHERITKEIYRRQ